MPFWCMNDFDEKHSVCHVCRTWSLSALLIRHVFFLSSRSPPLWHCCALFGVSIRDASWMTKELMSSHKFILSNEMESSNLWTVSIYKKTPARFRNPLPDHSVGARLYSKFDPNKQTLKIFQRQIPHLVLTLLLLGGYVVTILIYQAKQSVDRDNKRIFEAVSTGLILGLGLNFFEAFKDLAKVARWRILSSRFVKLQQVILVLGAESLMKVFRLMTVSSPKSPEFRVSIIWLLVNLIAQGLVAVLPFFASLKSGHDSTGVTISQGSVSVPKLDCFYRSNVTQCEGKIQSRLDPAIAHVYGEGGTFRDERCRYQSTDEIHRAS